MENLKKILLIAVGSILLQSCLNTPTVPVPPPEMTAVTSNANGTATVTGPTGTAEPGDIVLVFNESWGVGVMELVEETDGSFVIEIEAGSGDQLIIQVKRNNHLSREEGRKVPPLEISTDPDTETTAN